MSAVLFWEQTNAECTGSRIMESACKSGLLNTKRFKSALRISDIVPAKHPGSNSSQDPSGSSTPAASNNAAAHFDPGVGQSKSRDI